MYHSVCLVVCVYCCVCFSRFVAAPTSSLRTQLTVGPRIGLSGSVVTFEGGREVGLAHSALPFTPEHGAIAYFEALIVDTGERNTIAVGLVPDNYPQESQPVRRWV
jgi:hypothetical protein